MRPSYVPNYLDFDLVVETGIGLDFAVDVDLGAAPDDFAIGFDFVLANGAAFVLELATDFVVAFVLDLDSVLATGPGVASVLELEIATDLVVAFVFGLGFDLVPVTVLVTDFGVVFVRYLGRRQRNQGLIPTRSFVQDLRLSIARWK